MRSLMLVAALAACSSPPAAGPAPPEPQRSPSPPAQEKPPVACYRGVVDDGEFWACTRGLDKCEARRISFVGGMNDRGADVQSSRCSRTSAFCFDYTYGSAQGVSIDAERCKPSLEGCRSAREALRDVDSVSSCQARH